MKQKGKEKEVESVGSWKVEERKSGKRRRRSAKSRVWVRMTTGRIVYGRVYMFIPT